MSILTFVITLSVSLYVLGGLTILVLFMEYERVSNTTMRPVRAALVILVWPIAILYATVKGLLKAVLAVR